MIDFVIEKGIPIPERRRGNLGGASNRYPFGQMEVGDSFFCPGASSSVEAAANLYGKRSDRKFSARYVEGGTRIWRTA